MVAVDGQDVPLGKQLSSASPNEVQLAEQMIESVRVTRRHCGGRPGQKPRRAIAGRAYNSDPLRQRLAARGWGCGGHASSALRLKTQDVE